MENLSNTEILNAAAELRLRLENQLQPVLSAEENRLLVLEKEILERRERGGFSEFLNGVLIGLGQKRKSAEMLIAEARAAEAHAENLAAEKAAAEKLLTSQKETMHRLENVVRNYKAATSTEAEKATFLKRFYAAADHRVAEHMEIAAREIGATRIIAEFSSTFVERQKIEIASTEKRLAEIGKEFGKLK